MNTIEKQAEEYCLVHAEKDWGLVYAAYLACASAMNGSAGVWVTDGSLPKEDGSYFCYLSHDDNFPHEPPIKSSNEYRSKGGWVYLSGWKIIKWLDESVSSPSPQINSAGVNQQNQLIELRELVSQHCITYSEHGKEQFITDFILSARFTKWLRRQSSSPSPLEAETADKKRMDFGLGVSFDAIEQDQAYLASQQSAALESENKELHKVLKELVELKGMKDLIEADNFSHIGDYNFCKSEYERRKPLAWEAARKLVKQ